MNLKEYNREIDIRFKLIQFYFIITSLLLVISKPIIEILTERYSQGLYICLNLMVILSVFYVVAILRIPLKSKNYLLIDFLSTFFAMTMSYIIWLLIPISDFIGGIYSLYAYTILVAFSLMSPQFNEKIIRRDNHGLSTQNKY